MANVNLAVIYYSATGINYPEAAIHQAKHTGMVAGRVKTGLSGS